MIDAALNLAIDVKAKVDHGAWSHPFGEICGQIFVTS